MQEEALGVGCRLSSGFRRGRGEGGGRVWLQGSGGVGGGRGEGLASGLRRGRVQEGEGGGAGGGSGFRVQGFRVFRDLGVGGGLQDEVSACLCPAVSVSVPAGAQSASPVWLIHALGASLFFPASPHFFRPHHIFFRPHHIFCIALIGHRRSIL